MPTKGSSNVSAFNSLWTIIRINIQLLRFNSMRKFITNIYLNYNNWNYLGLSEQTVGTNIVTINFQS